MRRFSIPTLLLLLVVAPEATRAATPSPLRPEVYFEPATGTDPSAAAFLGRAPGYDVRIAPGALVLRPRTVGAAANEMGEARPETAASVALRFVGAASGGDVAPMRGESPRRSVSHHLRGPDAADFRRSVPHFDRVRQSGLYPGIDVVYYGTPAELEYDFEIAPGADAEQIAIDIAGVDALDLHADGSLRLQIGGLELEQAAPVAYQVVDGERRSVPARFALRGERGVAFALGDYDRARPLVIDPVISFATYLGGSTFDVGRRVVVDASGRVLVIGRTMAVDFPVKNALQSTYGGAEHDAFFARYDAGGALEFATYLGGSEEDWGYDVELDEAGHIFVCGRTASDDLPAIHAFQPAYGGGIDAFIAKLDPTGQEILWLTYLGGSGQDRTRGLVVAGDGSVVVTGQTDSDDLPTVAPLQASFNGGPRDAFVARITPGGESLVFLTYLGGVADDVGVNLRVRGEGDVVVTGITSSADFPTVNAHQATLAGSSDLFVTKLSLDGQSMVYSTYLGGTGAGEAFDDTGLDVALDANDNAYIAGRTSAPDFPALNAVQPTHGGGMDATVSKFAPDGTLLYATFLGGTTDDESRAIAVDDAGVTYVTGRTTATDFPVALPVQATLGGAEDAFVTILSPDGAQILVSTYLGGANDDDGFGIALDSAGNVYVAGETSSTDFPVVAAEQPANAGSFDGFLARIALGPEVSARLRDDGGQTGQTRLSVSVRSGAFATRRAQLKLWLEIPPAGVRIPLAGDPTPVLAIGAGQQLDLLVDIPLPASLTFPGTTVGARLVDEASGALLSESLCTAVPCH